MKRIFVFVIFMMSAFSNVVFADTISIVADEWCPYNCSPNEGKDGYIIEIAEMIFKKAGHTVEYNVLPWSRSIDRARKGKYAAIVGAAKGDAPDFIFPAQEQGMIQNAFFVKKGNAWRYSGVDSLKKIKLGVIQDYDYGKVIGPYLEANKNTMLVQFARGDNALESNIKKAEVGRLDVILEDENVFLQKAAEMGKKLLFENAGYDTGPTEENKIYIAFSPANPKSKEYASILSDGLDEIRKSGALKKILEKYGLNDWRKQ